MSENKPKAGDVGIIPHTALSDHYMVIRIAKFRDSGNWDIEIMTYDGTWSAPRRRQIDAGKFIPLGGDPVAATSTIREIQREFAVRVNHARDVLHRGVAALAALK